MEAKNSIVLIRAYIPIKGEKSVLPDEITPPIIPTNRLVKQLENSFLRELPREKSVIV